MSAVWKALGVTLMVASLGWGVYNFVSTLAHEERIEVNDYDADQVESLVVDGDDGSVSVAVAQTDRIVVTAEISDGLKRTEVRQGIVGEELRLDVECPVVLSMWCSVDYTVQVPPELASRLTVDIEWSNGASEVRGIDGSIVIDGHNGNVEVDDVSGPLTLHRSNGNITATRVSSSVVDADSHSGRIDIEFVESPQSVKAHTSNGRVDVVLPNEADVVYDVRLDTTNGDMNQDVAHDPRSDRTIDLRSFNGDVTARYAGAATED